MDENKQRNQVTITPALLNREQIAKYIEVSERTISNMTRSRRIPVIKFGGSVRFDPIRVMKALQKYVIQKM